MRIWGLPTALFASQRGLGLVSPSAGGEGEGVARAAVGAALVVEGGDAVVGGGVVDEAVVVGVRVDEVAELTVEVRLVAPEDHAVAVEGVGAQLLRIERRAGVVLEEVVPDLDIGGAQGV